MRREGKRYANLPPHASFTPLLFSQSQLLTHTHTPTVNPLLLFPPQWLRDKLLLLMIIGHVPVYVHFLVTYTYCSLICKQTVFMNWPLLWVSEPFQDDTITCHQFTCWPVKCCRQVFVERSTTLETCLKRLAVTRFNIYIYKNQWSRWGQTLNPLY